MQAQTWAKMRSDQREKVVLEFMKARLPKKQKVPVVSAAGSSLLLHDDTSNKESLVFDISSDDSGITSIPIVTLEGMWHKAEDLVNASNSITPAPGMSKKDKMVMSYSQVKPHYVQYKDSGQYLCDSECMQWCSSQICSHALAVAQVNGDLEKFLQWYVHHGCSPNLTTTGMSGLPTGKAGCKGGKTRRKRTRSTITSPDNVSLRSNIADNHHFDKSFQTVSAEVLGVVNTGVVNTTTIVSSPSSSISPVQSPSASAGTTSVLPKPCLNPFFLKLLSGNIRKCQGCKGSLRLQDGSVPSAPYDIVIARFEVRPYPDKYGVMHTPSKPTACHYHCRLCCIRVVEPSFITSTLKIAADIVPYLTTTHIDYI